MIEALLEALRAEFDGTDVTFYDVPPKNPVAPSIVVHPGLPFLEPKEAGSPYVREHWQVRAVTSGKDVPTSVAQMRRFSLKVRRAVNRAGGVWDGTTAPIRIATDAGENTEIVFAANTLHFRYDPVDVLGS